MKKYNTLVDCLWDQSHKNTGIRFLCNTKHEEFLSYSELFLKAGHYLSAYQKVGIKRGDELILQFESERSFLIAYWACLLGGIKAVPIPIADTNENKLRVFTIWSTLQQPWIATDNENLKDDLKSFAKDDDWFLTFEIISSRLFLPNKIDCSKQEPEYYEPHSDDIAHIMFSSGSTGFPKGVVITHKSVLTNIYDNLERMDLIKSDSFLSWMPLTHTFGFTLFHLIPLVTGLNQNLMSPSTFISNPSIWLSFVNKYQVSIIGSPNFGYRHFLKHFNSGEADTEEWNLNCVRMTWIASEVIPISLCNDFTQRLGEWGLSNLAFITNYGLTENSMSVSMSQVGQPLVSHTIDRTQMSVGQEIKFVEHDSMNAIEIVECGSVIRHTDIRITANGTTLHENVVGNIELNGPTVTPGYYLDPETTRETFTEDGWLMTGDLGFINSRKLFIIGRAKETIIVNGKNYYLHDIENVIYQGVDEDKSNTYIACGVPNADTGTDDLIVFVSFDSYLRKFYPIAKKIQKLIFKNNGLHAAHILPVKSIPKTSYGKIQRFKLVEDYNGGKFNQIIREVNQYYWDERHIKEKKLLDTNFVNRVTRDKKREFKTTPLKQTDEWTKLIQADVEELTGISDISETTSFYKIGLSSTQLLVLKEQLEKRHHVDIPIKKFFADLYTVNELSTYIDENCSVNASMQVLEDDEERTTHFLSTVLDNMERRLTSIEEKLTILATKDENILKADKKEIEIHRHVNEFGLSSDQRRVYFLSKLEGGNVANQIHQVYRLDGAIDIEILKSAFQEIASRHEMLRSSYHIKGSDVVHHIANIIKPEYLEVDLRENDGVEKFRNFFERPFNFSAAPLWRWGLLLDDQGYKIIINAHHIIADGYALNLIWNNLSDLLNGTPLNEAPKHYCDFVMEEEEFLNSMKARKQREWWLCYLNPIPPSLDLPADISRPEVNHFGGSIRNFAIDADTLSAIKTLAKENNATPFMALLAAWTAFLGKLSAQSDFCVAVPWNRRDVGNFKNTVGMFTQTTILRLNPEPTMSYIDYLRYTKDICLDVYSHVEYPFDMLLEDLKLPRNISRNPLFDVMVNYNNVEQRNIHFGDVQGVREGFQSQHAQFDLFLDLFENNEQLLCRLNYAKPLFSQERIDDWVNRFLNFIEGIIKKPEVPFAEFKLNHDDEQELLSMGRGIEDRNIDETTVNKLLTDVFKEKSAEPVVWFQGKEISYKELDLQTRSLVDYMQKQGIQPGDKIGLLLSRTPSMIASILAAIKIGCIWVPLDPSFPMERLRYMIKDSGIKQLISETTIMEYYDFALPYLDPADVGLIDDDDLEKLNENNEPKPNDIAYIIYTSGSSGKPKGVEIEHSSLANFTVGMAKALDWPKGARTACFTTYSFDIFLLETLLCLVQGGCVVLSENDEAANPVEIEQIVTEGQVDYLQMTPTRLQLLCADPREADKVLKSIKALIVGGEAFPNHLLPFLQRYQSLRIFNVYGPTETCVWSTFKELTNDNNINIGLPIANTDVYVLDDNRNLVSSEVIGDLWIGGSGVARGYHNKPELTAERFVEDPFTGGRMYWTGDRAMWKDGELESFGREDNQVQLRGFRIELGEIEEVLHEYNGIVNAVAAVQEISPRNHVLVAYFQSQQEGSIAVGDIKGWLAERLPEYMVADYVLELSTIPQTLNGKVDRKLLPLPDVNAKKQSNEKVNARLDEILLNIWKNVLGDKEIGFHDSFFDIGGNSFSLVLVHDELEKSFPGVVSVADLFSLPTISKLKEHLDEVFYYKNTDNKGKFTLPETWFETSSKKGGQIEAWLESRTVNNVKDLGADYRLDFVDTLFGLFALYLHKSLGVEKIPLWTFGYIERAACVNFDFQSHYDLSQVFSDLSVSLPTRKDYQELNSLNLTKDTELSARVGFVNEEGVDRQKLLRKFDFYLMVYEDTDYTKLTLDYGKRIAATALQNQLKQFIKMLSLVVDKASNV